MKHRRRARILSLLTAAAVLASAAALPVSVMAFDPPEPDNGVVEGISNGGEWTIYASKVGLTRYGASITDASNNGVLEVSEKGGYSAQFQFDLATMLSNSAVSTDKVVKRASLRLTPMVTRAGIKHNLYIIDNGFTTTEAKTFVTQFAVPRGSNNDINKDSGIKALDATDMTKYPSALATWQTDIDITGLAVTAENQLSFTAEYASGNQEKTEYATSNTAANNRLKDANNPLPFFDEGTNAYSKWLRPQIVFTYTDEQTYKDAYADFISASAALSAAEITETDAVSAPAVSGSSTVTLEAADDLEIVTVRDNTVSYNPSYVGSAKAANIKLTVANGTASYSKVLAIPVNAVPSYPITFSTDKNPLGEPSVTVGNDTYTDGTAYAKEGGRVTINPGANLGYTAEIKAQKTDGGELEVSKDGSFIMPAEPVSVSVTYAKAATFGTSRIAAINSISLKREGTTQGNGGDIIIAADRFTFVKFDLSDYNEDVISEATLTFTKNKNTSNTKAIFYIPNNDWNETSFSKDFCIDGTEETKLSAFKKEDGTTVTVYDGDNRKTVMVPDATGTGNEDLSSAKTGILGKYYLTSSGTSKSDSIAITEALKTAMKQSESKTITLLIYSTGGSGGDMRSVTSAPNLAARPSLTITESAEYLPDDALVTEIETVQDLKTFAEIVNGGNDYTGKTVTLKNNLDLSDTYHASGSSWASIGTQDIGGTKPFAGTFEGGNHSITGLYINEAAISQGLFGAVTGNIQNLTVAGEITGGSVVGGIAGWCSGNITNCHSQVNILAEREAGGIVGTLSTGGVISNCTNTGNITIQNKETYAGGIAAHNIGGIVEESENTGRIINDTNGFRNKLGGIVGYLDNGEIRDTQNTGEVVSEATVASYTADTTLNYLGGIVGYSSYGIIIGNTNSGAVRNKVDYAGGIAGFLQSGDITFGCTNNGAVSGRNFVGGIVGSNSSHLSNCRNDGAVTGEDTYIGGVVGYLSAGNLHDCSYDKTQNSTLELIGGQSIGTVTSSPDPLTGYHLTYQNGNAIVTAPQAGTYTLIFAAYDAKGILQRTASQRITFDEAGTKFSAQTFPTTGARLIKAMLWSDLDNIMKPLCAADTKTH